jgi:hypothetical protein
MDLSMILYETSTAYRTERVKMHPDIFDDTGGADDPFVFFTL